MKELVCNVLTTECDAICITTNGFVKRNGECVMGRGIAKQIKEVIPIIPKVLGNLITQYGNNVHILLTQPNKPTLISFPVKPASVINNGTNVVNHCNTRIGEVTAGFLAKADLAIIEESCKQLVAIVNKTEWKTILLPLVGCGAGELKYHQVKPILEKYLDDRFYICSFSKEHFNK